MKNKEFLKYIIMLLVFVGCIVALVLGSLCLDYNYKWASSLLLNIASGAISGVSVLIISFFSNRARKEFESSLEEINNAISFLLAYKPEKSRKGDWLEKANTDEIADCIKESHENLSGIFKQFRRFYDNTNQEYNSRISMLVREGSPSNDFYDIKDEVDNLLTLLEGFDKPINDVKIINKTLRRSNYYCNKMYKRMFVRLTFIKEELSKEKNTFLSIPFH